MRVYVDTNIIMDYLLSRDYRGELFFVKAAGCMCSITVSDVTLQELKNNGCNAEILLSSLASMGKLTIVRSSNSQKQKARNDYEENQTHYADELHSILASDSESDFLLTQNIKDFKKCKIAVTYNMLDIK